LEERALLSLTLVNSGSVTSTIVVAKDPTTAAAYAAVELQDAIEEMTGAIVPIVTDDQIVTGTTILVGESMATQALGYHNSAGEDFSSDPQLIAKWTSWTLYGSPTTLSANWNSTTTALNLSKTSNGSSEGVQGLYAKNTCRADTDQVSVTVSNFTANGASTWSEVGIMISGAQPTSSGPAYNATPQYRFVIDSAGGSNYYMLRTGSATYYSAAIGAVPSSVVLQIIRDGSNNYVFKADGVTIFTDSTWSANSMPYCSIVWGGGIPTVLSATVDDFNVGDSFDSQEYVIDYRTNNTPSENTVMLLGKDKEDRINTGSTAVHGTPQWTASGHDGGAMSFNGSSDVYVSGSGFTDDVGSLECWVHLTSLQSGTILRLEGSSPCWTYHIVDFGISGDYVRYVTYDGNGSRSVTSTTQLQVNQWYHITATHSTATGKIQLFINGQLQTPKAGENDNYQVTACNNAAIQIGAYSGSGGIVGYMDEVRVSNVVRDGATAYNDACSHAPYADANTKLLMRFDDNNSSAPLRAYIPTLFDLGNVPLPGTWDAQATAYAVYDFLENDIEQGSVYWFNPTVTGSVYPSASTVTVSGTDIDRTPTFDMRYTDVQVLNKDPDGSYTAGVQTLWPSSTAGYSSYVSAAYNGESSSQIARDVNIYLRRMRQGGKNDVTSHSFADWPERFYGEGATEERHDDWFNMINVPSDIFQVDFFNQDVIDQVAADAAAYYDTHGHDAHPFNVVPQDNRYWYSCDDYPELSQYWWADSTSGFYSDGSASNYVFYFVNQVVTALHQIAGHGNDKIATLAYANNAAMPQDVTVDPDVDVQFCFAANRTPYDTVSYNNELGYWDAWATEAATSGRTLGVWLYSLNPWYYSTYILSPTFKVFPGYYADALASQLKMLAADGAKQIFSDGWGQEVESYVAFKLMNDSSLDVSTLLDDYFTEMYGTGTYNGHTTAYYMCQFYELVEDTYCTRENYPAGQSVGNESEAFAWGWLGTADVMSQLQGYIDAATTAAGSSNVYATNVSLFNLGTWSYMQAGRADYLAKNPPTVSISSPANNATVGDFVITAAASDNGSVTQVDFYGDGDLLYTDTNGSNGWSYAWSTASVGLHSLMAVATDNSGLQTCSSTIAITVENRPQLTVVGNQVVNEGQALNLTNLGVFMDLDDTAGFTYNINWGDGLTPAVSIVDIPATGSDAASGLSSSKTYTHALDFGNGSGTIVVNGVTFNRVSSYSQSGSYGFTAESPAHASWYYGNPRTPAASDGNMSTMLNDFFHTGGATNGTHSYFTLFGLTPGVSYSTRIYYRPTGWDPINPGSGGGRNNTITFNGDGVDTSIQVYEDSGYGAHYVEYDFTATGTAETITFVATSVNSWHLYALTNEVIPRDNIILSSGNAMVDFTGSGQLTQGSFDGSHTYADNGVYTVTAIVADPYGGYDTKTFQVTVNNVAPNLWIEGAGTVVHDQTYTLYLHASDPGSDTINHWDIDWGDGNQQGVSGNPSSVAHVYTSAATRSITATVTDEDGTYATGGNAAGTLDPTFGDGGMTTTNVGIGTTAGLFQIAIQSDGKMIVAGGVGNGEYNAPGFYLARYNADGSLDTRFGTAGHAATLIGSDPYSFTCPYGITIQPDGRIVVVGASDDDFCIVRYLADGQLDSSFGDGGIVTTDFGGSEMAFGVAIQSDGKIVVAGETYGSGGFVVRYNADGTLDSSFGTNGRSAYGMSSYGYGVAIQSDGKIVLAGCGGAGGNDFALARYNTNGSLDTSFDSDGKVTTDFNGSADGICGVALQSDGKIVAAGYGGLGGEDFAVARYNTDGSLDSSFNSDGKTTTDFFSDWDGAVSVALQSDGKIVVSGYAYDGSDGDFAIARYNTDGSLDTSFDSDGKVTTDFAGYDDGGTGVAIQSNGEIVAVGSAMVDAVMYELGVARYNSDGSLDTSFDSDGKRTDVFDGSCDDGQAVAVQSDGKTVVAFSTTTLGSAGYDFGVARYNVDGTLDTSFGTNGKVVIDFDSDDDNVHGVAIQSDGKIVVAGAAIIDGHGNFALVRFNSNGTLDTGLGTGGKVTTSFSNSDAAFGVAIQSDGKIVVAGTNGSDFALARYNTDGSLDTSFDSDGKQTTNMGGTDMAYSVAIQSDGKLVVAGKNDSDFAIARYNTDGSLDTSFSGDGKQTTDFGGSDYIQSIAIQSDGKIVAVGAKFYAGFDFAMARYNTDGSLDTSFDSDGKVTTDFGNFSDVASGVAIQSDGKIVAAGKAGSGFGLARYNANGSLDTDFDSDGKVTTGFGDWDGIGAGLALLSDGRLVVAGTASLGGTSDIAIARYLPGAIGKTVVVT
jgi:uncharacterized delta-60 repeat protein